MKARNRTIVTAVLATLLITGVVFAQGFGAPGRAGGGGGPMGQGFGPGNLGAFGMLADRLDLSDAQQEEIETIMDQARDDMQALREEAGDPDERTRFMDLFTSPTLTVSDLEENLGRDEDLMEAGKGIIFQAIVDIHDVLTAEQLEELAEIVEDHEGHGGMGGGMMGGRGMGSSHRGGGSRPMSGR